MLKRLRGSPRVWLHDRRGMGKSSVFAAWRGPTSPPKMRPTSTPVWSYSDRSCRRRASLFRIFFEPTEILTGIDNYVVPQPPALEKESQLRNANPTAGYLRRWSAPPISLSHHRSSRATAAVAAHCRIIGFVAPVAPARANAPSSPHSTNGCSATSAWSAAMSNARSISRSEGMMDAALTETRTISPAPDAVAAPAR